VKTKANGTPYYDLEHRTSLFAANVFSFINGLRKSLVNVEIAQQLVRSAGSVGANYIEANESLGQKDFLMHIRISKKEAKESMYWLSLLDCPPEFFEQRSALQQEAKELMLIFGAILRNFQER
jgi:four helix bundle protein